jgi:hypothetical protein
MSEGGVRSGAGDAPFLCIDVAINPFVKMGVAYWHSLCGQRRFPARDDLTLRGTAAILPYSVIVRVIDGGADFEYRYVGESQRQAFKTSFKGLRLSQIEAAVPQLGSLLRAAYERVRSSGEPFLVRGRIDHEPADSKLLYHESAFLPLGISDAAVDHILIVGVQIPEPFWHVPAEKLTTLVKAIGIEASA